MDSFAVLEVARAYNKLGWAVQEQLNSVFEDSSDENLAEQNMNALAQIHEFCQLAARHEDDEFGEFSTMVEQLDGYAQESGGEFRHGRWVPGPESSREMY